MNVKHKLIKTGKHQDKNGLLDDLQRVSGETKIGLNCPTICVEILGFWNGELLLHIKQGTGFVNLVLLRKLFIKCYSKF